MTDPASSASLTIAVALAGGTAAQALAVHLRMPGIVLLLALGVILGPDILNIVRPETLGGGLLELVNFAVAVILFEGGLNLDLDRLRKERLPIRRLVTTGALVTALAGTLVAYAILGWGPRLSALFGTLIIVTGPTVVTPLLRRIKVVRSVSTILEAEGVLIDAVGAIVAAAALEIALVPTADNVTSGLLLIASGLGFGALVGAVGGFFLALLLRFRKVIPEGLENIVVLSFTLALFQLANLFFHESGIAAVTVAGVVVGNSPSHIKRELHEFKEQLTVMFIGMLFVLLAADVRVSDVVNLGWRGAAVVAAVIVLVRPLTVWVSTRGGSLNVKQRVFLAWIGPRGIVAAAVASLFAAKLDQAGIAGGASLRALVFSVIAATVLWSGFTGGLAARFLGLRRKQHAGWIILGANRLARTLAMLLQENDEEVVCIESNPRSCAEAEKEGLRVLNANGLTQRTLHRAEIDTRAGAVGLTPNEEVNLLFAQRAGTEARGLRLCVALRDWEQGITKDMIHKQGAKVLFGAAIDVERWSYWIAREEAQVQWWRLTRGGDAAAIKPQAGQNQRHLTVAIKHSGKISPASGTIDARVGDEVALLFHTPQLAQATTRLEDQGWAPVEGD